MSNATATRTNRYAAPCVTCGQTIPAGAGALRREDGEWVVRHADGCGVTVDRDRARIAMTADGVPADQVDTLIDAALSGSEPELLQTIVDGIAVHFPARVAVRAPRRSRSTSRRCDGDCATFPARGACDACGTY